MKATQSRLRNWDVVLKANGVSRRGQSRSRQGSAGQQAQLQLDLKPQEESLPRVSLSSVTEDPLGLQQQWERTGQEGPGGQGDVKGP